MTDLRKELEKLGDRLWIKSFVSRQDNLVESAKLALRAALDESAKYKNKIHTVHAPSVEAAFRDGWEMNHRLVQSLLDSLSEGE